MASTNRGEGWRGLFKKERVPLSLVARMVLRESGLAEAVLSEALTSVEGADVFPRFQHAVAVRAIVKASVGRNLACDGAAGEAVPAADSHQYPRSGQQAEMQPWLERAVYFLREALEYSRRDTALLLKIRDSNVDQLLLLAEKRIGRDRESRIRTLGRLHLAEMPSSNFLFEPEAVPYTELPNSIAV